VLRLPSIALPLSLVTLLAACGADPAATGGTSTAASSTSTTTTSSSSSGTTTTTTDCGGQGGEGGGLPEALEVDAGETQHVEHGEHVFLSASATAPYCHATFEYAWTQIQGTFVALDDPSSPAPELTAPASNDSLRFSLLVTDDQGDTATSEVEIYVGYPAPIASAGPDRGGLAGAKITLVGSGSDSSNFPLTFAWTQVSGPPVALDVPSSATASLSLPAGLAEPLVYALVVDDGHGVSAPDWVTVRRLDGPDSDGDLVEDDAEIALGTDPADADSDDDGIPDGWEILGHEDVDYAALGCDPRHRDLLVEMDVQEYTKAGVVTTARPTAGVLARLTSFYAELPITNPDGIDGITLHLVEGETLPEGFSCASFGGPGCWIADAPLRFEHRESFHRASICLGIDNGCGEFGGQNMAVSYGGMDGDPGNDLDEEAAYNFYRLFVHEMGHDLSLHHGGDEDLNDKPNYHSVMNYSYEGLEAGGSIATRTVAFSHGLLPALDECALVEQGAFAGVPGADLSFLSSWWPGPGWTATADGSVDWNGNGTIESAPYVLVLRGAGAPAAECALLHDHDDFAAIAKGMGPALLSGKPLVVGGGSPRRRRMAVP
jgi:hypothetical protein